MATIDIERALRAHYNACRARPAQPGPDAEPDYCLISRYLDGTASPDECSEVKRLAVRDPVVAELIAMMTAERKRAHAALRGIVLPFRRRVTGMAFKLAACAVLVLGGIMTYVVLQQGGWRVAYRGITSSLQQRAGSSINLLSPGKAARLPYSGSFALLIGNSAYTNGWKPLEGSVREVADVGDALYSLGFQTTIRTNLTKQAFQRELAAFMLLCGGTTNSRVLIYYAGHGGAMNQNGYLVMTDAADPDEDPLGCMNGSVDMEMISGEARKMRAKQILCVFNCCYSGLILDEQVGGGTETAAPRRRPAQPGRQFITAAARDERVRNDKVFQTAFLDVLSGRVPDPIPDGMITANDVYHHLANVIPAYHHKQHPQYLAHEQDLGTNGFVFMRCDPTVAALPQNVITACMAAAAVETPPPVSTNPALRAAQLKFLFRQGDYSNCYAQAKELQGATLADPSVPSYWRVMAFQGMHGQVCRIVKDSELIGHTEREYETAERACSTSAGTYFDDLQYQWGQFYRARAMADEAIDRFEWIQQHAPASNWKEGTAYYLARLYLGKGDTSNAVLQLERLSRFSPAAFIYEVDQRAYIHVSNALATVRAGMAHEQGDL